MEFVALADVITEHIRLQGLIDLTILGIPVVADLGDYSGFKDLRALGVRSPPPGLLPMIHELGYMVKRLNPGAQDNKALNRLQHVLRTGVETEGVIVALTEISILLARYPKFRERIGGKQIIDTLAIYGTALAECYLRALPEERRDDTELW